jgi:hypothetical protein
MNMNIFFVRMIVLTALMLAILSGCKYDVAEPMWDNSPAASTEVAITNIDPAQATPGVNVITINGTGFAGALDTTVVHLLNGDVTNIYRGVYFDNVAANIIECTPTTIKVLRPNLSGDTIRIKIVSDKALTVVKFGPYKIDAVVEPFGSFVANVPLSTVTVDNAGNLYVVETTTRYLWKVAPDGQKTTVMTRVGGDTALVLTQAPSDLKISPDGRLFYLQSVFPRTKEIHMVDLNTPTVKDSLWYSFAPVKNVICGDFDANGYLYTAGRRSGIQVIRPNRTKRDDGYYATDTVTSMRVFNGYVYAATRTAIYRHSISDTSKVGTPELVLDLTQGVSASRPIKALSFSADGSKMYIGTDSQYPILVADATSIPIPPGNVDILYQGILSPYCKQFCFGNYLYMISGNVAPAVNWILYKVDVGTTGAPYY